MTECNTDAITFSRLPGRRVVADFNGVRPAARRVVFPLPSTCPDQSLFRSVAHSLRLNTS